MTTPQYHPTEPRVDSLLERVQELTKALTAIREVAEHYEGRPFTRGCPAAVLNIIEGVTR